MVTGVSEAWCSPGLEWPPMQRLLRVSAGAGVVTGVSVAVSTEVGVATGAGAGGGVH